MATLSSTGRFAAGEACADNDILYGPYATVAAAHAALLNAEQNVVGRTVGIQTGNTIEEYWYQGGTTEQHLVKKQSSDVEANPTGEATTPLNKIKIGETNYNIPQTDTSNLATKQELQQGLSGKQDIISDLQQIRTRADEGHTALQPIQDATPNNFVIFDENGGIKDSGKKDTDFATAAQGTKADNAIPMPIGTDGQILEKDSNETSGVKWVNKPSDGQDGASAYELYEQAEIAAGRTPLSQEAWLASLKANIGAFKFVDTVAAVQTQFENDGVGSVYSSSIDGVTADASTLSVILLMTTSGLSPEKTYMIATQDDGSSGFEFVYAGDLQSAMPSNVLTNDKIDNDFSGGSGKVAGADEVKDLKDDVDSLKYSVIQYSPSDFVITNDVLVQYREAIGNTNTAYEASDWKTYRKVLSNELKFNIRLGSKSGTLGGVCVVSFYTVESPEAVSTAIIVSSRVERESTTGVFTYSVDVPSGAKSMIISNYTQELSSPDVKAYVLRAEQKQPYIYPEDYGAIVDGTTDDSTAIQNAINAASVIGGTVLFASKVYRAKNLTAKNNVTLKGTGNTIIKIAASTNNGDCILGYHNGLDETHTLVNFNIYNITFDNDGNKNCDVVRVTEDYPVGGRYTWDSSIVDGCTFKNGRIGLYVTTGGSLKVLNSRIESNSIGFMQIVEHVYLTNVLLWSNTIGAYCSNMNHTTWYNVIFGHNTNIALRVAAAGDPSDNTLPNDVAGVLQNTTNIPFKYIAQPSYENAIIGGSVIDSKKGFSGTFLEYRISGIRFMSCGEYGIGERIKESTISICEFAIGNGVNQLNTGIKANMTNSIISGCIFNNIYCGISYEGNFNSVIGNQFNRIKRNGILIEVTDQSSGINGVRVSDNYFCDNSYTSAGLYPSIKLFSNYAGSSSFQAKAVAIVNNTFIGNDQLYAFEESAYGSPTGCIVSMNIIRGATKGSFHIRSYTTPNISDNNILGDKPIVNSFKDVTFTLLNVSATADSGMTWQQWLESEYYVRWLASTNTPLSCDSGSANVIDTNGVAVKLNSTPVIGSDEITSNSTYTI